MQAEVDALNKQILDMFNQYKVIIAGGRYFSDYELLKKTCDEFLQDKTGEEIVIISGHASRADTLGERYAQEKGFKIETYPADWKKYGRAAGTIRNEQMANIANALVAFWDGKSKGTKSMISLAKKKGLQVFVAQYEA